MNLSKSIFEEALHSDDKLYDYGNWSSAFNTLDIIDPSEPQLKFITNGGLLEKTLKVLTTSAQYFNDLDFNFEDKGRIQAFILIKKYFDECQNSHHFLHIFLKHYKFEGVYRTSEIPNPFDREEIISTEHGDLSAERQRVLKDILQMCFWLHESFEEAVDSDENEWNAYLNKRIFQDNLKAEMQYVKEGYFPDLSLILAPILMYMVDEAILGETL